MKKTTKHSQHSVVFHERPLVIAVRLALPYVVGLSLAMSMVPSASSRSSETAAAFTATQLVRQFTLKNTVSQVSLGMQGYVVDVNGQQRGPAMGAAPSGWPSDMGSVPDTVNLPRRDGAGRPLGYCAWDNSSTTPPNGYNQNNTTSPDLVYAVVSPGLNGTMETSCAAILQNGVGVGDDHVQVTAPIQVSSKQFKTSVATFNDLLATPGEEGDIRLVRDTNKLYSYVGGAWVSVGPFVDDASGGAGAISYTTGKVTVADFQASAATITGAVSADNATFTNGVVASTFTGNGAGLTDLNAANFSSGIISPEFGGTGVNGAAAGNGTLLIGNGSGFTLGTLTAGAGISVLNDAGAITISNSGVISITGTANQVIASATAGDIVLSLPQDIATTSMPTFGGMMLNGNLTGTTASFAGAVTVDSLSALRLNVGTTAGGVTNPNLIIGNGAMPGAQTGNGNNAVVGISALNQNTSGQRNTAVGNQALYANTTGSNNTANGFAALYSNTTGLTNVAIGNVALYGNTTGNNNVAIGNGAGYSSLGGVVTNANTTGGANTFLGSNAMPGTTTPLFNATALGAEATVSTTNTLALGRNSTLDQVVIGTDSRNDTFAGTKLYVNGVTNLNGDLRGTTATFTGAVTANSFVGDGSGLTNLDISNFTGILPVAQGGTGLDGSAAANGSLLIGNGTGYTLGTLTGTANQVNVTNGAGTITLSLPQSIATTSTPTFGGMVLNGNLTGTTATFGGAVTVNSLTALRLNVGTSAGPVTNPNLIIGNGAMPGAQSGTGENTAVGINALAANTSGRANVAVGYSALLSNTTGRSQVAIGRSALTNNTTGIRNSAVGNDSMLSNSTGSENIAFGAFSLQSNTTGNNNTVSGYSALSSNTTGSRNTAFGASAGNANTTGGDNTFLGNQANATSDALTFATAIGSQATVATSATMALGRNSALDQVVIGTDTRNDTFAGTKLYVNGVTNLNGDLRGTTATFTGALTGTTGTFTGAVTVDSLSALRLNVGTSAGGVSLPNVIVGTDAMTGAQSGFGGNTALGYSALSSSTSSSNNTAVGYQALRATTTGTQNVAVGLGALRSNTSGAWNTALGKNALEFATVAEENVGVGLDALRLATGSGNTAVGSRALDSVTSGTYNTALGQNADVTSATLSYATLIGAESRVSSSNTVVIGALGANKTGSTTDDQVVIGAASRNDTFAGTKLYVNGVTNLNGNLRGTTATFTGAVTANSFAGDGSALTNLNASNFTTGILPVAQGGTGLDGSAAANGSLLIGNGTGYTLGTLTGTANQVNVTNGAGTITLSLPQSIATTSTPTFGGLTLNGAITGTTGTFTGAVIVDSLSAQRLNVGTLAGGVTLPNLIIGIGAMPGAQSGAGKNTAVGINALLDNTTGYDNTAVGYIAMQRNTTGFGNSALGTNSLRSNTTGQSNTAFGVSALALNTIGAENTAIGRNALSINSTGINNAALGRGAGGANTTGNDNTFLGNQADATSNALSFATVIGSQATVATSNTMALGRNSAADQIVIGTDTRNDTFAGTKLYVNGVTNLDGDLRGTTATFTGAVTLDSLAAQRLNVGTFAGGVTEQNLIVGNLAMPGAQTGAGANTALGISALGSNTGGGVNTAIGKNALGANTTGSGNTAVGRNALGSNTTAGSNTAFGHLALFGNTTGTGNVAIGAGAGFAEAGGVSTNRQISGNNNTFLGANTLLGSTTQISFATAIGAQSTVSTSNTIALGRNDLTDQIVIGTASRNDTFAGTKLYVNGVTNLNGNLRGTTATFSGALTANSFAGNGSGLTNLNASNFNSGILPVAQGGTGLDGSAAANGSLLIGNGTGYTLGTLTGTANQVNVTNGAGTITLSLPQNIATTSSPTFGGMTLNGALTGTTGTFTGAVTVDSLSAQRLNVSTATGVTGANLIIGSSAMSGVQTGDGLNTAVGINALAANTSGNRNTAVGRDTLSANTTGNNNAVVGYNLLNANTTGNRNSGLGTDALRLNTTGSDLTALGAYALEFSSTASRNTAIGSSALRANTTGADNTANGAFALTNNTTGLNNVALGRSAGSTNTTGNDNTFLGYNANATTGALTFAAAIGSGSTVSTSNTIALGRNSTLDQIVIGTDTRNDTVANTKLYVNGPTNLNGSLRGTTANFTGRVDAASLFVNGTQVTGGSITRTAIETALEGNFNIALGDGALENGSFTGTNNTVFGVGAATLTTAASTQNVVVGRLAGQLLGRFTAADGNTLVGYQAGYQIQAATGGDYNTLIGHNSDGGSDITYGTALGASASVTGASYSTAIGAGASATSSSMIALGRNSTADQVVIGSNARNDTFANTKLYVNGPTFLNGDLRGTTATFTGAVTANSFVGNGSGLTNLDAGDFTTGTLAVARGGTGLSATPTNGQLLIGNGTGYTLGTLTGTANQINVTNGAGTITLSLPQSIATTSTPTFGGMALNGNLAGTTGTFTGAVTVDSLTAQRLNVGTLAGPVTSPNLIIGIGAMPGAQTGAGLNTAVGINTLNFNTTGVGNTAVGYNALTQNSIGEANVALGVNGLNTNDTGFGNTAVGANAGSVNVSGSYNTNLGYGSISVGPNDDSLTYATTVGALSRVGTSNTVVLGALGSSKSGGAGTDDQVVIGATSRDDTFANTKLYVNGVTNLNGDLRGTTANFTGRVDAASLFVNGVEIGAGSTVDKAAIDTALTIASSVAGGTRPESNLALGLNALDNQAGAGNLAIGANVLTNLTSAAATLGVFNTGVGYNTLAANTSGSLNTGMGSNSMASNTSGYDNTAIGGFALQLNSTGRENTAVGAYALNKSTTLQNTAIGAYSMQNTTTGFQNTAVGAFALNTNVGGVYNTALGFDALRNSTSSSNTAVGYYALRGTVGGINNTALGTNAGDTNITGNNNLYLGHDADATTNALSNVVAIGASSRVATSNTIALGRNSTADQVVIGTDTRNDTIANTKLYVNGPTNLNGELRGTTATFTGRVDAASLFVNGVEIGAGGTVDKAGVDTALTIASSIGGGRPESNLALGLNALDNVARAGNVAIGQNVLTSLTASGFPTEGVFNTGLGYNVLASTTTGYLNTGVGANALDANTLGFRNTAMGVDALGANLDGADNTAVGTYALMANVNSYRNTAVGAYALSAVTAESNTAVGAYAMQNTTTGYSNAALGAYALNSNIDGIFNTAVGFNALRLNTSGYSNTAVGWNSLGANTAGLFNTALGLSAGDTNTTGNLNLFLGYDADATTSGLDSAAAIGAGSRVATSNTIALGRNSTADQIVIGTDSRNDTFAGTKLYVNGATNLNGELRGSTATFSGAVSALRLNVGTSAGPVTNANLIIGNGAMPGAQTGTGGNTAVGINAMAANTTGLSNVVLGHNALAANTISNRNTVIGTNALMSLNTNNGDNTAVGFNALSGSVLGANNVAVGSYSLINNTNGISNTAIGLGSLRNNTSGYENAVVGRNALITNITGLNNSALGAFADVNSADLDHASVIGSFALVSSSNTVVLGTPGSRKLGGTGIDDQVVIGAHSRLDNHKLYVVGTARITGGVTTSSDRRLKTNIDQLDSDTMLDRLGQIGAYRYNYTAMPEAGRKIGVIAQEIENLFPEVASYGGDNYLAVDYGALGAMAAAGVGRLNTKFKALDKKVEEQGTKLLELEELTGKHDTRIGVLESWKTEAVGRMDNMQVAIDLNIQKIADNAVAIQTNAKAIERLDDALLLVDGQVKNNSDLIDSINARWNKNFNASEDGSVLTVNAVELKVSNFTAQNVKANSVYSQRLEAEMARIAELEVNNLRANSAVAKTVQAEQLNTGSAQVYAGAGLPAVLFSAKSDGHYTLSTSALDGSYATATIIVNAGQAKVIAGQSEGIELFAEGNTVKAIAAGKSIKASWIKTG